MEKTLKKIQHIKQRSMEHSMSVLSYINLIVKLKIWCSKTTRFIPFPNALLFPRICNSFTCHIYLLSFIKNYQYFCLPPNKISIGHSYKLDQRSNIILTIYQFITNFHIKHHIRCEH